MIEYIPDTIETALLYFHSAGTTAVEIAPFMPMLRQALPHTYIWAGDGVISSSPLMRQGLTYGPDPKRYWFTFPMQDASTPESFAGHVEAMGATLTGSGAYVNQLVDQIQARFHLATANIILSGFQHGACVALAAAMIRRQDPFAYTILLEPYLLEAYYLQHEPALPPTTVVCIDNQHIRRRTSNWLHVETDKALASYGLNVTSITVPGGGDDLDAPMMRAAVDVVQRL